MPDREAGTPGGSRGGGTGWPLAAGVTGAWLATWWVYNHADRAVAEVAIVPYAFLLLLGPVLVYVGARRGGWGGAASLALGLVVPALWLAKELHRVTGVFPLLEAAYYALSPISLGVFCAAATTIATAELWLRRRREGAWRLGGAPGITLLCVGLLALGAAWVGYDSGGREIFYGYIAVYRWLFPSS